MQDSDLEAALLAFDRTDANLRRLAQIWIEMKSIVPEGIAFVGGSQEDERYRELAWGFDEIASALPEIFGFRIASRPFELNQIAQGRLDASQLGEIEIAVRLSEDASRPGQEINDYRLRLDRARRDLVRNQVEAVGAELERLLVDLVTRHPRDMEAVLDTNWDEAVKALQVIERLAGALIPRTPDWDNMTRHIRFGQGQDLHDIATKDWPAIRKALQENLYSELEPLPVQVEDLGVLAAASPRGSVSTNLAWANINAEEFERLLFNILVDAAEYENVRWLTRTNASDRGRDLSAERIIVDSISGTRRERIILQAKHWLTKSIAVDDVAEATAQMKLWEPPPVHVLVFATSGRLTTDALDWIERHNSGNAQPRIEVWSESDLELVLARRPHIAAEFKLRSIAIWPPPPSSGS